MRAYYDRKRPLVVWSAACGSVLALALAAYAPVAAVALCIGTACGILNALLTMRGTERLLDHRIAAAFVFSSMLRIAVFGIVPVAFAVHGSVWSMPAYFVGFFVPLVLYAIFVGRAAGMR